jgi:hypothetical protein
MSNLEHTESKEVVEALQPEIRNYLRQFEEATESVQHLVEGLSRDQLEWKEGPDRWSIAECLSHLNVTADQYYPAIDRSMRRARERGLLGKGPFRHGFLMNRFIAMLEPPPGRSFKAPRNFRPRARNLADEVGTFFVHQEAIMKRVRQADGLDLARVKLVSPASRLLRMSLGQCFALLATHERRHLWQSARVKEALERGSKGEVSGEK